MWSRALLREILSVARVNKFANEDMSLGFFSCLTYDTLHWGVFPLGGQ